MHARRTFSAGPRAQYSVPRIFDHYDPKTVAWLLGDYVKKNQLGGGTLY